MSSFEQSQADQSTQEIDAFYESETKVSKPNPSKKSKPRLPKLQMKPAAVEVEEGEIVQEDSSDSETEHTAPVVPAKKQKRDATKSKPKQQPKKSKSEKKSTGKPESSDDDDEGSSQEISIPKGHIFLGEWRGASVKQLFGSVVVALHRYEMLKNDEGLPIIKKGKLLTNCKKYEFTMKQRELEAFQRAIPQLLKQMEKESAILAKIKESSFGSAY